MANYYKNHDEDEEEEENRQNKNKNEIFIIKPKSSSMSIYFYDEIYPANQYRKLIEEIGNLGEDDEINMHFACDGGVVSGMTAIINALNRSPALIRSHLDSHAYSAAAIMFLCAQEWVVSPGTSLMFHNYSGGLEGKGHELGSALNHQNSLFRGIYDLYCADFLTKKEIDDIFAGMDLYISADDIKVRLDGLVKARKAELEKKIKGLTKRNATK